MGRVPVPVFLVSTYLFQDWGIDGEAIPALLEPIGKRVGPFSGTHLQHDLFVRGRLTANAFGPEWPGGPQKRRVRFRP